MDTGHVDDWEIVVRLLVGGGLGAVIGFEREIDGHEAGVRTHCLLALGAALFGLLSVSAFSDFIGLRNSTNVNIDVSRIASYIPAGVGFIGAGTILKRHNRVRGLTTAASLWVAAAVGLAAGLGAWVATVAATVIGLLSLLAERPVEAITRRVRGRGGEVHVTVETADAAGTIAHLCDLAGTRGHVHQVDRSDDGALVVVLRTGPASPDDVTRLVGRIVGLPGVRAVHHETGGGGRAGGRGGG
jgi:putative Mg2+ transporter-C (MgtC) family protein